MEEQTASTQAPAEAPKGPTLLALVAGELALVNALYESGGEVTPEIEAMMAVTEIQLPAKVDGYAAMLRRIDSELEHVAERVDAYGKLMKTMTSAKEGLKERLKLAMLELGSDELAGNESKFRLMRAQPKLEVDDTKLPADLLTEKVIYAPNKIRIRQLLDMGSEVPGCRLTESQYVRQFINNPVKDAKPKSRKVKEA